MEMAFGLKIKPQGFPANENFRFLVALCFAPSWKIPLAASLMAAYSFLKSPPKEKKEEKMANYMGMNPKMKGIRLELKALFSNALPLP